MVPLGVNALRDLSGQKFGFLYVTGRAESRDGRAMWAVRCDCGVEKAVRHESLTSGAAKSCGCAKERLRRTKSERRYSLVNRRFGRLWVIWRAGSRRYGTRGSSNALWECRCDCGNLVTVTAKALREGHTTSCGCLQREMLPHIAAMEARA
jgi:hypothetical protein